LLPLVKVTSINLTKEQNCKLNKMKNVVFEWTVLTYSIVYSVNIFYPYLVVEFLFDICVMLSSDRW
jgi:hypothetical protein